MARFDESKILKTDYGFQFDYHMDNRDYMVQIVYPNINDMFNIPYILVLPAEMSENCTLAIEVNNLESDNQNELLNNALLTAHNLTNKLKEYNNPILVPIIPSVKNGIPYYQQLSRECFSIPKDNPFYRMDLQVLNIIEAAKERILAKTKVNEKIFLNGYSSFGVFAQRFALLHSEIVSTLCVGGASGSIPIPIAELEYPIGVADYFDITEKKFDFQSYSQIKFRYYVGSLEDKQLTSERYDDDGNYAPMHDMSYFDRNVPPLVGVKQRQLFGKNLFERAENEIKMMSEMSLDIEQKVFEGRTHNNYNGAGVNELGDIFIKDTYQDSINLNKKL